MGEEGKLGMELQQGRVRRELLKQNDDSFLFFQPGVCVFERERERKWKTTLTTMNNLIVKKTSKRMIILLNMFAHAC